MSRLGIAGRARRLGAALLLTSLAASVSTAGAATAAAARPRIRPTQQLAVLLTAHPVRSSPTSASPQTSVLPARTPITGEQTTLPVIGHLAGAGGVAWLRVMLPGRPNSSSGWIAEAGTHELVTAWHIVVDLGARRVSIYREGTVARSFQAVVGKPSTPTPSGQFFVEETLQMASTEPGGPFALALSARSNALQEFEGGPGQIAIHGRDNLGGTIGTAASHGCVRVTTANDDWLATNIGPGTPVTIRG
jgi:lipoprotein-anchoring transpeptidase ErfK/SrfK